MTASNAAFQNTQSAASYTDGPPRLVPGWADLLRMARLLLAERVPDAGRVLVVGAGGGLELAAFGQAQPGWRFDGVDPSADMLAIARTTIAQADAGSEAGGPPIADRVALHHGYIDAAPPGPFDAATCLLVMHFVAPDERRRTLAEIRRRLAPGAPFVCAHHSLPAEPAARALWLRRYAAFATSSGVENMSAERAAQAIGERLPIVSPAADEALLREAGFADVSLFYAAFSFRGWVAYA